MSFTFKIDLIVWKQKGTGGDGTLGIKFKIDLIVWKQTISA